jgi:tetratricopeptide (TPR) repeat protein
MLFIFFIIGGVGLTANECDVASDARRVSADVSTRELDQIASSFSAHDRLADRSHLGWGIWRLERALTQRTLALTDRVSGSYRMGLPPVRDAQGPWARDALARAIPVSGGDRRVRAAFRYCDGHLHRINGEAHKRREEEDEAQRELTEAVASFREAADLQPDWPDPFLGLARTFIYGLEDNDRGADAMNQAQQRGYTPTERETVQLADGYRSRGQTLVRSARELSGLAQESDYLTRAIEAYTRALMLYTQATSVPNVPTSIRQTQRALDQAQDHLDEISTSASHEPAATEPGTPEESATPAESATPSEPATPSAPASPSESATPSASPPYRPTRSVYREERAPWR